MISPLSKLIEQEQCSLADIGLHALEVLRVPIDKLHMQYRHELRNAYGLLDPKGQTCSIVESPLYKTLLVYKKRGFAALKRHFRDLDYYKMFKSFDGVGYKINWANGLEQIPFQWDDRKILARLLRMIAIYKSIQSEGYLSGRFQARYITALAVPFERSRFGRQFSWEPYELWGGHHRAAALAALGIQEAEVILLKDRRPLGSSQTTLPESCCLPEQPVLS